MIIPVYRVVTSQFPIAADYAYDIEPGMVVQLNSSTGKSERCGNAATPMGLAADRFRAAEAYEWTNRVSDFGQETRASGMLSVYHGGGEFYVDIDDSHVTTPNGSAIEGVAISGTYTEYNDALYAGGTNGGQLTADAGAATMVVARVIETEAALPSGIPGEFEPNSVSADYDYDGTGARTWIKIKLVI